MARLAIVGSRAYRGLERVVRFVQRLKPTTTVVSGGAPGVDWAAIAAAQFHGRPHEVFRAEWHKFGKAAGCLRNEKMIATVDGLVAFWDGQSPGTRHAIQCASKRGLWYRVYGPKGELVESQNALLPSAS
jgi:hypothetical protein